MVETLSNLVSHANATIQLNALWGLMVRKGGGKRGREEVGKMGSGAGRKGRQEERSRNDPKNWAV